MNTLATRAISTAALAAGTLSILVAPAYASHGGGNAVQKSGTCAGGGTFKLKAKHDDARIEVEYEVDTNRVGQVWHVRLTDNGHVFFSGTRRTTAPSGSFEIRRRPANRVGSDTVRAHATFRRHSCGGHVTV